MPDILRQIYHGRYITADISWQIYYGMDITADILQHIDYNRYIMADILRVLYYGKYIMADISRQIYVMADILRPIKTAISPQISTARSYRVLCSNLLVETHRSKDSIGSFVYKTASKINKIPLGPHHGGGGDHLSAQNLSFTYGKYAGTNSEAGRHQEDSCPGTPGLT